MRTGTVSQCALANSCADLMIPGAYLGHRETHLPTYRVWFAPADRYFMSAPFSQTHLSRRKIQSEV